MILSQLTAEMKTGRNATPDPICSPSPALSNKNQEHKGRDGRLTEHVYAVSSLSAMPSVPDC